MCKQLEFLKQYDIINNINILFMIVTLEVAFDFEFEVKMLLSSNFSSIRSLFDYVEKMSRQALDFTQI